MFVDECYPIQRGLNNSFEAEIERCQVAPTKRRLSLALRKALGEILISGLASPLKLIVGPGFSQSDRWDPLKEPLQRR